MNKNRLIITSIISIFLVSVLLIGSTYSIFTSQKIDETVNVYKTGNLEVLYDEAGEIQVDSIPKSEWEANGIMPYRITITNNGNVPYQFDVILDDTTSSTDNTINYDYIMTKVGYLESKPLSDCTNRIIKEDVVLLAGESVDIDIRVWVSDMIPNSEIGKSFYAKLIIDGLAVYNDSEEINNSNLSLRYMKTLFNIDDQYDVDNVYFRNDTYREKIKNTSFVGYIDTSNAISSTAIWDVSLENDNSVVAWLENNDTSGYYDLYIGASYKIYITNMQSFFDGLVALENISFTNLDTSLTIKMSRLFKNCISLIDLDVSGFDTSNVTDMVGMFYGCNKLTSLDVSNLDTCNVTDMNNMFGYCGSLTSLDVSNFDTSNVTDIYGMFRDCSGLTSLNLSNFDTSNVTNLSRLFQSCINLTSLDLSNFDTRQVTLMHYMFYGCNKLTSLDVSNFDTCNVTDMNNMFYGCNKLTSLDVSNFDTCNVTDMNNMFGYCGSLTSLDVSNFDTSNVTDIYGMFRDCSGLTSLNLSNFDTSNVTNLSRLFQACINLTSLDLSNFDTSQVTSMHYMFGGCNKLNNLDVSSFNTSNVTDMEYMFFQCFELKNLNIINFDTSNVIMMDAMFYDCSKLITTINIKTTNATHTEIFTKSAIETGTAITVNYTSTSSTLVDSMIATKSENSNVVKGILVV